MTTRKDVSQGDMNVGLWRGIETAPKDGTEILSWSNKQNIMPVVFDIFREMFVMVIGDDEMREFKVLECEPTHWMPLPQPPLEQMEKSDEDGR